MKDIFYLLSSSNFTEELMQPFSGEPIGIPSMLRRWPNIKEIYVSEGMKKARVDFSQRIPEGIHPVQISSNLSSEFKLVLPSEFALKFRNCLPLDQSREGVILVQCH